MDDTFLWKTWDDFSRVWSETQGCKKVFFSKNQNFTKGFFHSKCFFLLKRIVFYGRCPAKIWEKCVFLCKIPLFWFAAYWSIVLLLRISQAPEKKNISSEKEKFLEKWIEFHFFCWNTKLDLSSVRKKAPVYVNFRSRFFLCVMRNKIYHCFTQSVPEACQYFLEAYYIITKTICLRNSQSHIIYEACGENKQQRRILLCFLWRGFFSAWNFSRLTRFWCCNMRLGTCAIY